MNYIVVCPFVHLLAFVLPVLLWFTDYDNPFNIFKLFLFYICSFTYHYIYIQHDEWTQKQVMMGISLCCKNIYLIILCLPHVGWYTFCFYILIILYSPPPGSLSSTTTRRLVIFYHHLLKQMSKNQTKLTETRYKP